MNAKIAYREYTDAVARAELAGATTRPAEITAAWDALPLRYRLALCARCGWLDVVYELSLPLGLWIDQRRSRV